MRRLNRWLLAAFVSVAFGCASGGAPQKNGGHTVQGKLFRINDVAAYDIKDAQGNLLGRAHSRYLKNPDGFYQVQTRVHVEPGQSAEHVTVFRDDMSPVLYKRLSSVTGRTTLEFRSDRIRVFDEQGASEPRGSAIVEVLVPDDDLMMLALALRHEALQPGDSRKMDIFSPDALRSAPWSIVAYADAQRNMVVELPSGKVTLGADGRVERYERSRDGTIFTPQIPPQDPPKVTYDPPLTYRRPKTAKWTDRPVKIDVAGGVIAGVLSVPEGRAKWPGGLAPVVVFISEDGPHDRHGHLGRLDYGTWRVADFLVEQGVAFLRVDDRGTGASKSTLSSAELTHEVAIADALALIRFVEKQPGVSPERLFVLGHGRGGLIALAAAAQSNVSGLALLATPLPRESTKLAVDAALKSFDRPVIVMQGLKDVEVSWKDDAKRIVSLLEKGKVGRDRVASKFYDRVDHLMKTEPQTSSFERYLDRTREVDDRVLDDLAQWIAKIATAAGN